MKFPKQLFSAGHLSLASGVAGAVALSQAAPRPLSVALIAGSYLSLCWASWISPWLAERRQQHSSDAAGSEESILIGYASQTGFALSLAQKTAEHLQQAGLPSQILSLNQLTPALLQQTRRLLLIVSTTGEGDAPDNADQFCRKLLPQQLDLHHLQIGLLALGDRHYSQYCAFGHQLAHWFAHRGATPLCDLIEVDNGDEAALRHWQHYLGKLSGHTELADWSTPDYQHWTLQQRQCLNPDSQGSPVFHLRLTPPAGEAGDNGDTVSWKAGDIAEIGPQPAPGLTNNGAEATPLPHREYSISSLPGDGGLELLVRQLQKDDGSLGLGSGWLTAYAEVGQAIQLRIRSNPQFHTPGTERLILIGNGTGLAGLRAHLKQRIAKGQQQNWLIFGERQRSKDFFHQSDILDWQAQGWLPELDLCFSRDQAERRYVQHALRERAELLADWVAQGAAILVCGSLQGMAGEVHQTLLDVLGEELLDQLSDQGRYLRDVY
ncbi:sulfite reductase subunit alpha [Undibacterium curvum]|uniref:NADPH--hemoprotein reductase n=1 Tax=Undibacterium curvum TaxID=2762294 RepID=A0ABR7A1Z5_9BURK|nr:sulfite reductase subunit alpha [Undibacterium curvum]MBC3930702.1 flavodoxin domain-containing protein [Undibacterium curvum]